jgi:hypothetical protein
MANEFEKVVEDVGHGIKVAAEDVVKFPSFVVKAAAVLETAIKDQPEVKAVLTSLVQQGESIAVSVTTDVAGKGLNLAADAATLALVESFFVYFKSTVIPMIENIYGEIKVDVSVTQPVATADPIKD